MKFYIWSSIYDSTSIGDDCSIEMYGQVRKHGITDPVGISESLYFLFAYTEDRHTTVL